MERSLDTEGLCPECNRRACEIKIARNIKVCSCSNNHFWIIEYDSSEDS